MTWEELREQIKGNFKEIFWESRTPEIVEDGDSRIRIRFHEDYEFDSEDFSINRVGRLCGESDEIKPGFFWILWGKYCEGLK